MSEKTCHHICDILLYTSECMTLIEIYVEEKWNEGKSYFGNDVFTIRGDGQGPFGKTQNSMIILCMGIVLTAATSTVYLKYFKIY